MNRNLRVVEYVFSGIIVLLLTLYVYYFVYGFQVSTSTLYVDSINVSNNAVNISGDTSNSSIGFSGYNVKIEGAQLLIKPRYSFVSIFNPYGKFNIRYNATGKDFKEIFIVGKEKYDKKEIWSNQMDYKHLYEKLLQIIDSVIPNKDNIAEYTWDVPGGTMGFFNVMAYNGNVGRRSEELLNIIQNE